MLTYHEGVFTDTVEEEEQTVAKEPEDLCPGWVAEMLLETHVHELRFE